jgi:hypothetical protein
MRAHSSFVLCIHSWQSLLAVDLPALCIHIGINHSTEGPDGFPSIPFYVYAANVVMCLAAGCVLSFMGGYVLGLVILPWGV